MLTDGGFVYVWPQKSCHEGQKWKEHCDRVSTGKLQWGKHEKPTLTKMHTHIQSNKKAYTHTQKNTQHTQVHTQSTTHKYTHRRTQHTQVHTQKNTTHKHTHRRTRNTHKYTHRRTQHTTHTHFYIPTQYTQSTPFVFINFTSACIGVNAWTERVLPSCEQHFHIHLPLT